VLVLVLDTSSAAVAAALVDVSADGASPIAEHVTVDARGHAEYLAPMIDACLRGAGATPGDLRAVVAGTGPGPFTGLRVGLVTAAVMSETLAIPAYGVCSLDGIAADAQDEGQLVVMTDARRREVYWARYDHAGERVVGPDVSRPADIPLDGVTDLAGAGARQYADLFADRNLIGPDYPRPASLVGWARDRILGAAPSEPLTPLYLRRPDAVAPGAPKAVSQ
jgi:tRNA threonylcarbamoyl adenosine modification protein YeaZ